MTKTLAVAAALLLGTSFALAQKNPSTTSPGASGYSPGHEMKDPTITNTGPGASDLSPGHMKPKGTVGQARGASEFSPGDRMNDKRGK